MTEWKPKLKSGARFEGLNLTGEEGFVLSRLDGTTSLRDVVHVTGLPEGRVKQIVEKLVQHGAVEADARSPALPGVRPPARPKHQAPDEDALAAARDALLDDPSGEQATAIPDEFDEATLDDQPPVMTEDDPGAHPAPDAGDADAAPLDATLDAPTEATGDEEALDQEALPAGGDVPGEGALEEPPATSADAPPAADAPLEPQVEDGPEGPADDNAETPPTDAAGEGAEQAEKQEKAEDAAEDAINEAEEANHRKLYETELSKLELVELEAMARTAKDPHLSALCFDPHPSVIKGIFDNSVAGFPHARLVARHHRTPQGLDVVLNRAEFFRDTQTQRLMLANTMLQDAQLRKLLGNKRLAEVYKVTLNRDIPERNRQKSRHILRSKWATAEGEERAGLVFNTEGRCLMQLTGLPFDSQTTSLLCAKTYTSSLLIQNLARFSATPPLVLTHLSKQAVVRRQAHLRALIAQHPNCPSDVKRKS